MKRVVFFLVMFSSGLAVGQDWQVIETVDKDGAKTGETVVRSVIRGQFSNEEAVNQAFCGIAEIKRFEGNKKQEYFYLVHFQVSNLCKEEFIVLLPYSVAFIASDGRRFDPKVQVKSFYGDKKQQDYLVRELFNGPLELRIVSNGKAKIIPDGGAIGFYRFELAQLDESMLDHAMLTENVSF